MPFLPANTPPVIDKTTFHQTSLATITLDFSKPGVPVSPTLYGLMTEEINYSYDGGLYGELVRNRAFLDDPKRPSHWSAVGDGGSIELMEDGPSKARPAALKVQGGAANEGFWGIPVKPSTDYHLSVWIKGSPSTRVRASIESPDGKTVYASATLNAQTDWRNQTANLRTSADQSPTKDARLVLKTTGQEAIELAQVSLFPPTYRSRPNGNRSDLMRLLVDMNPKFLRFPGGNYVEGNSLADYFPWKQTLGPINARPGHRSPWGYRSTDGMGLLEFLEWCEDMHASPLLAVYAGYALDGKYIPAGPGLEPFVQDALDEIEYVTGSPATKWGHQRAMDGHPKPFPLQYVEVGNEDGADKSGSYPARLEMFNRAIKAKYPALNVISTTGGKDWLGSKVPITAFKPDVVDEHYYSGTWDMMAMANRYDDYDRNGPKVFVGEWASHDGKAPWDKGPAPVMGPTPDMECAIADAAFLTGIERNSDVVPMACYAPLLVNLNPGGRQWFINLIGYDCIDSFGSPSYYAQKMFASNVGDRTVPLTLANLPTQTRGAQTIPALFASATKSGKTVYVKLVNAGPTPQEVEFKTEGSSIQSDGAELVLTGDPKAVNTLQEPQKVAPVSTPLHGLGATFHKTLAPNSVTVLTLRASK